MSAARCVRRGCHCVRRLTQTGRRCTGDSSGGARCGRRDAGRHDGDQRVRPIQDRDRTVEFAHGRADAGGRDVRPLTGVRPAGRTGNRDTGGAVRLARGSGHGHGSVPAVVLGLLGEDPETVEPAGSASIVGRVGQTGKLALGGSAGAPGTREIDFEPDNDIVLHRRKRLPFHSNAMVFTARDAGGAELSRRTYYSVGGGFVLGEDQAGGPRLMPDAVPAPYPFASGAELLTRARESGLPISGVMLANELVRTAGGSGGSPPRASTAGGSRGSPPRASTAGGSGGSPPRASTAGGSGG